MGLGVGRQLQSDAPSPPRCRSRHRPQPGTRAERRRLRSRLRAARFQEAAARGQAEARGRREQPVLETVALRPHVDRALHRVALERGVGRATVCVEVLEQFARRSQPPAPAPVDPDSRSPVLSGPTSLVVGSVLFGAPLPAPATVPDGYFQPDSPASPGEPAPASVVVDPPATGPGAAPRRRRPYAPWILVGCAVSVAAALWLLVAGSRYQLAGSEVGEVFVLDRFTGRVWACSTDPGRAVSPACRSVVLELPGRLPFRSLRDSD